MTNPVVSVIMLTYNRERYLRESISSVLSQTFQDLELIILDDGSTDASEQLIRNWGDSRIRYFRFDHTGKASRLRNWGIENSTGKFIAFLDSDDIWLPWKISDQLADLSNNPESLFIFTNVIEFNDEGKILRNGIYTAFSKESIAGNIFNDYVQGKFPIYPSTMLFDRRCLLKVDKLNELFSWTDNEFFHRLAFHYRARIIQVPLVKIRKHAGNTSSELGVEMVSEMIYMMRSFREKKMISRSIFTKMISHFYYLSGILNMRAGHHSSASKAFVNCALHTPWKAKAWIRSILCLLHIPRR